MLTWQFIKLAFLGYTYYPIISSQLAFLWGQTDRFLSLIYSVELRMSNTRWGNSLQTYNVHHYYLSYTNQLKHFIKTWNNQRETVWDMRLILVWRSIFSKKLGNPGLLWHRVLQQLSMSENLSFSLWVYNPLVLQVTLQSLKSANKKYAIYPDFKCPHSSPNQSKTHSSTLSLLLEHKPWCMDFHPCSLGYALLLTQPISPIFFFVLYLTWFVYLSEAVSLCGQ